MAMPTSVPPATRKGCVVGCGRLAHSHGLCRPCQRYIERHGGEVQAAQDFRERTRPRGRASQRDGDVPSELPVTFEDWAEANGYDKATREYQRA